MMDFEKGLVSIVTPVYNGEKYIHILLESVLNQTYDKVQMIVADDGSTDRTLDIVEAYTPRFVEKGYSLEIATGEHSCAAGAMCLGLPKVKGEFLIWPDGDDVLLPESIAKRVSFLEKNVDARCVRSDRKYVDMETGREVKAPERTGNRTAHNIFLEMLNGETYVCCGCYMLRSREFFEIYPDGQIPVYGVGQNFQMLLPYMYQYDCYSIDEPLYIVNRREDSHSKRQLSKEEEYKKYKDYECLVDDVVRIAKISNTDTLKAIEVWKFGRQKALYEKHKDYEKIREWYKAEYDRKDTNYGMYCLKMCAVTPLGIFVRRCIRRLDRMMIESRERRRKKFLAKKKEKINIDKACVISSNCLGGVILHDLGLPFCSPFVNLNIMPADYVKMLKSLPEYLESELCFYKQDGTEYPVAKLKDITIRFVHYDTEEEARTKWNERVTRMDYDRLYFLFSDRDGATREDFEQFDKLPYQNKVVLVNRPMPDIKSAVYLKGYEKEKQIGMLMAYKNKISCKKKYDAFDYVSWLNGE